jgi:hypothetical protein
MATSVQWAQGYARQADADFQMFQSMESAGSVADCHKLMFLQMACEKLVKAHLCGQGQDPASLQASHAFIQAHLPVVLRQQSLFVNFTGGKAREAMKHTRHMAQEIDVLAPAVKRGGIRPDNCEYPWEDAVGRLHIPLDWTFYPSRLLVLPAGRTVLKLIRGAITRLV